MKKQHIKLSDKDKTYLENFLSKGVQNVRVQKRALALQLLDQGKTYKEVQKTLGLSYSTVLKWAKKYKESGLAFMEDKARSGRPIEINGEICAKVTALACSTPPEGYGNWSLRLLSD